MNKVFETETFADELNRCTQDELEWIDKIRDQLKENFNIGKVLRYYWFREKKYKGRRLYFVTNTRTRKALLISIGSKKEQEETIKAILQNMDYYLGFIS